MFRSRPSFTFLVEVLSNSVYSQPLMVNGLKQNRFFWRRRLAFRALVRPPFPPSHRGFHSLPGASAPPELFTIALAPPLVPFLRRGGFVLDSSTLFLFLRKASNSISSPSGEVRRTRRVARRTFPPATRSRLQQFSPFKKAVL